MKKRRKKIEAYACVGSNGKPFYCAFTRTPELQGRFEIFESYNDAFRMALSKHNIRRVTIFVEQEPAICE
jgi:hypothetical protein